MAVPVYRTSEPQNATSDDQHHFARTRSIHRKLKAQYAVRDSGIQWNEAPLSASDLADVVAMYVKRLTWEDLDELERRGGTCKLLCDLCVLPQDGLSDNDDIKAKQTQFGKNEMPKKSLTPFWKLLWEAGADPMLRILMIAAVVSLVLGIAFGENPKIEWIEGAAIFLAVWIVIIVTAVNDYVKEKQFANLYAQEEKSCSVIRNGKLQRLSVADLVVGDILSLETGDEVPADALILTHQSLRLDESSLTGESDMIAKLDLENCLRLKEEKKVQCDEACALIQENKTVRGGHHILPSPVILSGSVVTQGTGKAVVIAVGAKSQVGKLFTKLAVDTEPTPLQNKLNALARDVGKVGFVAALITLVALLLEYWILYALQDPWKRPNGSSIANSMVDYVVTSITIIVVAVPEGLPLAVTISLAFSVGRMLKDQNYVRRLAACETMGGANEICSDKTGTLTKNQMEVDAFWNGSVLSTNIGSSNLDEVPLPPDAYKTIMAHNVSVNSTGYLEKDEVEIADGTGRKKEVVRQVGSPTECALLLFIQNLGFNYDRIRRMYQGAEPYDEGLEEPLVIPPPSPDVAEELIVHRIPFSSDRKVMSTVVKHPQKPGWYRLFLKGAAEVVLRRCAYRVDSEGALKGLTLQKIERIENVVVNQLASLALRTICLAYRDFDPKEFTEWQDEEPEHPLFLKCETELCCLGIAGIRDPVREEVPGAVRKCQEAGIKVRMCTGDNIETAKQIALKANIFHPEQGGIAMLGPDFLKLVGGVICEKCKTEHCPCESREEEPGAVTDELLNSEKDDDDQAGKGGCCRRGDKKGKADAEPKRATRVDVLGNPEAFERIADKLEVLARSQPNDKYALVTGLKNRGAVVAVTGDGTNDAPALKKADVGFAMGITGKEVAKQAADIILLDDNFESIVRACKWGRNIYDNIQRFLQFQLTVNAVAVITAFVGAVILRGSPLSAVQLLWVNLIMDTFAALALATEMPTDKLLNRPPHSRTEYLVSKMMFRNILAQALYQCAVMMTVIFSGECWLPEYDFNVPADTFSKYPDFSKFSETCGNGHTVRSGRHYHPFSEREDYKEEWTLNIGPSRHYTYVFNIFVFMQAFNLLNARKIGAHEFQIFKGLFSNVYWMAILLIIVVGQVLLVEFGQFALNCHLEGLTWQQWIFCLSFGVGTWIVAFLVKLLPQSVIEALPETGAKEVNPLDEPTSLALASRGRISSGRISARMNILSSHHDAVKVRQSIVSSLPQLQSTRSSGARRRTTTTSQGVLRAPSSNVAERENR